MDLQKNSRKFVLNFLKALICKILTPTLVLHKFYQFDFLFFDSRTGRNDLVFNHFAWTIKLGF